MNNTNDIKIIKHADDFGACIEVTDHIMDVYNQAGLSSVSVLVNGRDFERSMQLLKDNKSLKYSIHFNITEGHCVADKALIPLLINQNGMFDKSFFSILARSFLPGAKGLKEQIKIELGAQLEKMTEIEDRLGMARFTDEAAKSSRIIRVDSHQHFHMIPMVLKSILEICEEKDIDIEYLRVPSEPLGPVIKCPRLYHSYRPINFIKNRVLAVLASINHRSLKPYINSGKSSLFFGMIMSCEMDKDRVNVLLPGFIKKAEKKNKTLEILAHPGQCTDEKELMDKDNILCREFYMSDKRMVEKDFLLGLK